MRIWLLHNCAKGALVLKKNPWYLFSVCQNGPTHSQFCDVRFWVPVCKTQLTTKIDHLDVWCCNATNQIALKSKQQQNNIINFVVTQNPKAKNTHVCLTLLLVSPNSGNGGWSFGSKLDLSILISAGLYRTPTRRTCKQRWACLYNQMISGVGVAMRCINLWPSAEASMASLSASRRLLQAAVRLHGRVTPQKVRWRVSYASHIFIKL